MDVTAPKSVAVSVYRHVFPRVDVGLGYLYVSFGYFCENSSLDITCLEPFAGRTVNSFFSILLEHFLGDI